MNRITDYKPCLVCGGPARVIGNRWKRTKFCSRACQVRSNGRAAGALSSKAASSRRIQLEQPTSYRLIPLTRGGIAEVDIEDYEYLSQFNWCLTDKGYARRTTHVEGRKANERLHRLVAERMAGRTIPPSIQIDHGDGNRLNCRRYNLRPATHNQNSFNIRRKNKFGYAGVSANHAKTARYCVKINAYKLTYYIGTFDTPEEAAWMHDVWAIALHGDFARLNFDYFEVPRQ